MNASLIKKYVALRGLNLNDRKCELFASSYPSSARDVIAKIEAFHKATSPRNIVDIMAAASAMQPMETLHYLGLVITTYDMGGYHLSMWIYASGKMQIMTLQKDGLPLMNSPNSAMMRLNGAYGGV